MSCGKVGSYKLSEEAEVDLIRIHQRGVRVYGEFPAGAQLCAKCNTTAVVMMDGCMTCLSCGDSKCG